MRRPGTGRSPSGWSTSRSSSTRRPSRRRSTSTRSMLKDGARIEHRRICPKEDREVPYEEIVKGYEVAEGKYVVLDEGGDQGGRGRPRQGRPPRGVRRRRATIDPIFFEKTYYVGSRDDEDAYRLLHEALRRSGRAGHRPLHLPRPRVPGRRARARRRDRAAHPALPRRGRRRRATSSCPTAAGRKPVQARGRDGRPASSSRSHAELRPDRLRGHAIARRSSS